MIKHLLLLNFLLTLAHVQVQAKPSSSDYEISPSTVINSVNPDDVISVGGATLELLKAGIDVLMESGDLIKREIDILAKSESVAEAANMILTTASQVDYKSLVPEMSHTIQKVVEETPEEMKTNAANAFGSALKIMPKVINEHAERLGKAAKTIIEEPRIVKATMNAANAIMKTQFAKAVMPEAKMAVKASVNLARSTISDDPEISQALQEVVKATYKEVSNQMKANPDLSLKLMTFFNNHPALTAELLQVTPVLLNGFNPETTQN